MGAERMHTNSGLHRYTIGLTSSAQFAIATGANMVPISEVRLRWSRNGMPCASLTAVRRW